MAVRSIDAALDVLDRAEDLLKLDSPTSIAKTRDLDVRRLSLSMGVAALDTYMHWRLRRMDLAALSKAAGDKLELPLQEFVHLADLGVRARQKKTKHRPQAAMRRALNKKLLTMTFQSARQWETAFGYLGVKKGLSKTAAAMTPPQAHSDVVERLNRLSHRRNQIVHEGDLRRLVRPQNITRESLKRSDVEDELTWIRNFLTAASSVS